MDAGRQTGLMPELVEVFTAEAAERLAAVDACLLELERSADAGERALLLERLRRELHTLKGSSGAVGLATMTRIAHGLEDLVRGVEPSLPLDPALADVAAGGVREMRASLAELASGGGDGAAPEAPPQAGGESARHRADDSVRLSTQRLDALMARVGELVVARAGSERRLEEVRGLGRLVAGMHGAPVGAQEDPAQAERLARAVAELSAGLESDERRLAQVTSELEDEVRRTRMLPVAGVLEPLRRQVRDLARELGRDVAMELAGGDTEVDRAVLDQIRAPLTHLIRNAVDHGIERPDERVAAGKPAAGTIRVAAAERGGRLVLSVADDGRGVDADAVRRAAGAVTAPSGDAREALRLIFRPGLTTAPSVGTVSGRGIGLDAVRDAVERLGGSVEVTSSRGEGTVFTMTVPLSVASTGCLLVSSAGQRLGLPIGTVARIVSAGGGAVRRTQGREVLALDDGPAVLARLDRVLGLDAAPVPAGDPPAVVLALGDPRVALVVDTLDGAEDLIVTPLPRPLGRVRHATGAAVLGTGEIAIVLNAAELARSAGLRSAADPAPAPAPQEPPAPARARRVMVVDDSIVTRMLEKGILEVAGYEVAVAADGEEAWRALQSEPCDCLVSDVDMPGMSGLELVARVRADARLAALPVVVVTSLGSPEDHARAMEAGADAYIVKSSFSQEGLLATVGRLA